MEFFGNLTLCCLLFTHLRQSQWLRHPGELFRHYPQANAHFSGVTAAQPASVQSNVLMTSGAVKMGIFPQFDNGPQLH